MVTAATTLLSRLYSIKEHKKPLYPDFGICFNATHGNGKHTCELLRLLRFCFATWKHHSGDNEYPVEGNCNKFIQSMVKGAWRKTSKYGRLRWNLLNHTIRELELFTALADREGTDRTLVLLKQVRDDYHKRKNKGICNNLISRYLEGENLAKVGWDSHQDTLQLLIKYWPLRKGSDLRYPVEGSDKEYDLNPDKWNIHTTYGQRRVQLLDFMIRSLEELDRFNKMNCYLSE